MRAFSLIFVCLFTALPAIAAEDFAPAPSFQWSFGFGGAPRETADMRFHFQLNADRRFLDGKTPAILDLDFSSDALVTRLVGVPVAQRDLRLSQSETTNDSADGGFLSGAGDFFKGLGLGTGAVLLAGGAAVALIVASGGGGDAPNGAKDGTQSPCGGRGGVLDDGNGTCVVPCPGPGANSCVGNRLDERRHAAVLQEPHESEWMLSRNGQMGDLLPE